MRRLALLAALLLAPPALAQCTDLDGDGYFVEDPCTGDPDCNDADADTNPGAAEVCDGYDNDCSGLIDDDASCDTTCDPVELIGEAVPTSGFSAPFVFWTGDEYGIVGGVSSTILTRLDRDGVPLAPDQVLAGVSNPTDVVWNGSEYAVVWNVGNQIRFQRFTQAGTAIGSYTIVTTGGASGAKAAWSGNEYLVVWTQSPTLTLSYARLDRSGSLIGSVTDLSLLMENGSVVWTGSEYGVYYSNADIAPAAVKGMHLVRIDPQGNQIGSSVKIEPCSSNGGCYAKTIVWNGTGYAVTWETDIGEPDAYFARLDATGQVLGSVVNVSEQIGQDDFFPSDQSLAWSGSEYAIVFHEFTPRKMFFVLLDASGSQIGDVIEPIPPENFDNGPQFPRVVWNGEDYGVLYLFDGWNLARMGCNCVDDDSDGTTVCNDCDDADGRVYPDAGEVCDGVSNDCNHPTWPALWGIEVDNDGDGLSSCQGDCNDGDSGTNPSAAEVCDGLDNDCSGFIDDDASCDTTCDPIEWIGEEKTTVGGSGTVTWTGSEFGVVWRGDGEFFSRFDSAGNKIGGDVTLNEVVPLDDERLVWNGEEYAFTFKEDSQDYLQRLDSVGTPIGARIPIPESRLVWNGSSYARFSYNPPDASGEAEIHFRLLDPAGSPVGPEIFLAHGNLPDVAWDGSGYGVFYDGYGTTSDGDVFFLRLDETGVPIGAPTAVVDCPRHCDAGEIVWNGSGYGVTWKDNRLAGVGPSDGDIYFGVLDAAGQWIGGTKRLTTVTIDNWGGGLAWSGSEYAVTWYQGNAAILSFVILDSSGDPIAPVLDTLSFAGGEKSGEVFWTGSGHALFYTKYLQGQVAGTYVIRMGCNCLDGDGDLTTVCNDCDDTDDRIYPGATEVCDGVNNDCDDPVWPALSGVETDDDGDTLSECADDCDDTEVDVYPGAPQICDGLNNDCDDGGYPIPPADELDVDGDTFIACAECDDAEIDVYPGAPQICDGLNNDCDDGAWPTVPADDADADQDGFAICDGDCADGDATRFPDAEEICNALDDDCDTLVDEDEAGEDTDGDTVHNACDNCPDDFNTNQFDEDEDGHGNACDNCLIDPNPDQADQDADTHGDVCDNCPSDANFNQNDLDEDGSGDACDCALTDPDIYPDAPEINDGIDNQCPGDYGYGMADETSGNSGFHDPANKHAYSWTAQSGATSYEVVRSAIPDFSGGCASNVSGATLWVDPTEPGPYGMLAYLNRPMAPNVGSWGPGSAGERTGVCP